jgi:two-component system KDP operon response regulator KdpE
MTSDRATVLVIDDEPPIRRLLRTTLTAQDYRVIEAADGQEGLSLLRHEKPDVLLVDLGLPDIDGLELIRKIRAESPVPIVVLSSRDDEKGKVEALDLGADDYVTKPFGMEELVARLRTALRHRLQQQGGRPTFRSGDLTVDLVRRIVTLRGEEVKLSPKEYDLLQQFVVHAGKVLTHRHLLREVWKDENGGDVQYLRVYVRQLRQKIETDPERPTLILTEPGVGYRLQV